MNMLDAKLEAKTPGDKPQPDAAAVDEILAAARDTTDYSAYLSLCRRRRKIGFEIAGSNRAKQLRIALLGGSTTDFLELPVRVELETLGLGSEFFSSDYNTYVHQMMDPGSEAAAFAPDVAVFLLTPFNIAGWPGIGDSAEDVQALAEQVCGHWLGLCESFHANTNCEIVITNMHLLPTRALGNLASKLPWDANSFLRRVNAVLGAKAPPFVHILDVDTLSSIEGVSRWFDPRFWHHSKQPVAFDCMVPFIRNLSAVIGAIYGRTAKCVVLDLDNTLWGGVVGDDGVEGLRIGEGDAQSEAFKTFQEYLLKLKQRGVVLAVCSKNEEANALAPFDELPEMVLKRDDFVSFQANWDPKPGNIERIAAELNIGLDSLVFVDDNPAERELVRQALPQVKVVELTDDPADYPGLLDRTGWLEIVKLTAEDLQKTHQYRENLQRSQQQAQYADYGAYLESLEQKAVIRPFDTTNLDRITQLINKTNQFNVTTPRLTRSEVEALMDDPDTLTVYVRLVDKFGDNGLISLLSAHREDGALAIDFWLMSCRVLKRGVENLIADHVFRKAAEMGLATVRGTYKPTAKNGLVENLFRDLGFERGATDDDGAVHWSLATDKYVPAELHITVMEDFGE